MTVPAISIILPTFNGSKYLEEAIFSCQRQSLRGWELIIVDDASTDATPKLISRLMQKDSRIRTVRHEVNRKLPAALNTGFSIASGRYLTWTSDDNCYRPQALEEMYAYLESNPDIGLVFSGYSVIDEHGNEMEEVSPGDPKNLHLLNCVGPSFLYRRGVYEKIGRYSEDHFLVEDYDFWLRTVASFVAQPLHKNLYLFRRHSGSLTQQRQKQISLALERLLAANFHLFESRGKKVEFEVRQRIVCLAVDNRHFLVALDYLCRALFNNPMGCIRLVAEKAGLLEK